MIATEYIFTFDVGIPMDEVCGTLELARLAVQTLHGAEWVELGTSTAIDLPRHEIVIQATNLAGARMVVMFLGYGRREFGTDAIRVRRALLQTTAL